MGLFKDRYAEQKDVEKCARRVERMGKRDGKPVAGGRVTRSISAELRGQPGDAELIYEAKRRERQMKRGD